MNKHDKLLTLSYFNSKNEEYNLSDLTEMLGFNQSQLHNLLNTLKSEALIAYVEYELQITNKGLIYLISNDFIEYSLENSNYNFKNIDKSKAIPFDQPYVPKDFLKKI